MSIKTNSRVYHKYFMKLALLQAKRMLGNTSDNPSVGCVITQKGNIISSGVTNFYGRPHAEYQAIKSCKKSIKNSNLYVTLEPCSHFGKTPPCVNLIIKNKIKKVYFAIKDPDIRSYNKSSLKLKKANIIIYATNIIYETNIIHAFLHAIVPPSICDLDVIKGEPPKAAL